MHVSTSVDGLHLNAQRTDVRLDPSDNFGPIFPRTLLLEDVHVFGQVVFQRHRYVNFALQQTRSGILLIYGFPYLRIG